MALARRYGLRPYRYQRQRSSTLMVRAPERFLKEIFLPALHQMAETLHAHLSAVTDRVVAQALDSDSSDASVVVNEAQFALEPGATSGP